MGDKTGISWTDATWNPVRGCSRVSEGCRHCYAERVAARFSGPGQPYEGLADRASAGSKWTGEVSLIPEHLADPLRWKRPRRIFVNSMSDLFHERLTNEQIAAVFGVMAAATQHTFQVLTKRTRRMREWFEWVASTDNINGVLHVEAGPDIADAIGNDDAQYEEDCPAIQAGHRILDADWPLPNVWIGASVENQDVALERITDLINTPAALRFLSCEPLLGFVDLGPAALTRLGWVIAGCESGPGARTCDVAWLRLIRDRCAAARVPFFLKQAEGETRNGIGGTRHIVPLKPSRDRSGGAISIGDGSKLKSGHVIELPYLDGVQHAAFPAVSP